MNNAYFYSKFTRIWHWLQAALIVGLLFTGYFLHSPQPGVDFAWAVKTHNTLALVLLVNAGLGLFYFLTNGGLRQYNFLERGFINGLLAQLHYYGSGIFKSAEHPFHKSPEQRLNPLQRATYVAVLGGLLPVQAATGLLQWNSERWPEVIAILGGAVVLSAVHTTVSWLFAAFIIMHVYMATTGHSWSSNFVAMVTGWELVEEKPASAKGGSNE